MTSRKGPEFVISRIFKAPRQRVWDAWTQPALIARWFGPKGSTTTVLTHELRPGGMLHTRLDSKDGTIYGKNVYEVIEPPARLQYRHAFADAHGNTVKAPFFDAWPLELASVVTFEEVEGGTKLTVSWTPIDATPEEIATFEKTMQAMTGGWTGSFDQLDDALHPDAQT